jgi:hypothetical protein
MEDPVDGFLDISLSGSGTNHNGSADFSLLSVASNNTKANNSNVKVR